MQEAFAKLFTTGDTSQTIALAIILLLTFLLGMLVWALLMHFPKTRALKKANKGLEHENALLKKENKDYSERYTVVNAKLSQTTDNLQTVEASLNEKIKKVETQEKTLKEQGEQLELHKNATRNAKEDNVELQKEYAKLSGAHKANKELLEEQKTLVEELKGIIEDEEKEKSSLKKDYKQLEEKDAAIEHKFAKTSEDLVATKETVELLKKDLEEALQQKAELKKMLNNLEETEALANVDDNDIKTQLVGLKSHVKDLETENAELMERLAPYLKKEKEQEKEKEELDQLMLDLLVEAETNMDKDGFFSDYEEEDLIEDKMYLVNALKEVEAVNGEAEAVAEVEVTVEEDLLMNDAMEQVTVAMNMQGFYGDIEEAVLVDDGSPELPDEALMEKHLTEVETLTKDALFFQEETTTEGFVEDEAFLENQLKELNAVEATAEKVETVTLEAEEDQAMESALGMAIAAMQVEGLYAPIDSEKLMGTDEDDSLDNEDGSYSLELEEAVRSEIGRSIPTAEAANKDDLKRIDGVGMFIEQRLNEMGIYTFEQIGAFDANLVAKLGAALGFSEQTISRDRWVEQARDFLTES